MCWPALPVAAHGLRGFWQSGLVRRRLRCEAGRTISSAPTGTQLRAWDVPGHKHAVQQGDSRMEQRGAAGVCCARSG